jgi:hypothetical protein
VEERLAAFELERVEAAFERRFGPLWDLPDSRSQSRHGGGWAVTVDGVVSSTGAFDLSVEQRELLGVLLTDRVEGCAWWEAALEEGEAVLLVATVRLLVPAERVRVLDGLPAAGAALPDSPTEV